MLDILMQVRQVVPLVYSLVQVIVFYVATFEWGIKFKKERTTFKICSLKTNLPWKSIKQDVVPRSSAGAKY